MDYYLLTLEERLYSENPSNIKEDVKKKFDEHEINTFQIIFEKGTEFYRARVGTLELKGSVHDLNLDLNFAYYGNEIGSVPSIKASGGRFNREGYSFLYLGSKVETCIAELRAEVNQVCSVAKFTLENEGKYFDLTMESENKFYNALKDIMTSPISSEKKYKYQVTQLLSDIIQEIGYDGIYYNSTLSDGFNIVCFNPKEYKFVKFSERMYKPLKVNYQLTQVYEKIKDFDDFERGFSLFSQELEESREQIENYLESKIEYEINKEFDNQKKIIDLENDISTKENLLNDLVIKYKGNIYISKKVFELRGNYFKKTNNIQQAVSDYYFSYTYINPFYDNINQLILDKFNGEDEAIIETVKSLIPKITSEEFAILNLAGSRF